MNDIIQTEFNELTEWVVSHMCIEHETRML